MKKARPKYMNQAKVIMNRAKAPAKAAVKQVAAASEDRGQRTGAVAHMLRYATAVVYCVILKSLYGQHHTISVTQAGICYATLHFMMLL